jgi:hypothetical protein
LNPDVIAHFDSLNVQQVGDDRVRVSGVRGSNPPPTHKVCINTEAGYKTGTEILLTGLDIEEKAEIFLDTFFESLGGREQFDRVETQLIRTDNPQALQNEEAQASLRIHVHSKDPNKVGRLFSAKMIELALANYPGFSSRGGTGAGSPVIAYWPALVDSKHIVERVHVAGEVIEVVPTSQLDLDEIFYQQTPVSLAVIPGGEEKQIPLGRLYGTRSGDKGGCANVGVWAKTATAYAYLVEFLTIEKFKELMPDVAAYDIDRYEMPNLKAMNFFIRGILGEGVSANNRLDGQAKSMGEYLRSRTIDVPSQLAAEVNL